MSFSRFQMFGNYQKKLTPKPLTYNIQDTPITHQIDNNSHPQINKQSQ